MKRHTLLLEGGAMRGVFTAGVLDAWGRSGIFFSPIAAVSAGTLHALSYLSRQPGRNIEVNRHYAPDKRYMGLRHLLREGSYFNFDFMFKDIAEKLIPFDYQTFHEAGETLYAVLTSCETGKAVYVANHECALSDFLTACRVSSSIPVFCRPVEFQGHLYVDGGAAVPAAPLPDELPFPCGKPVYVLTREYGYRKPPFPAVMDFISRHMYRAYPALTETLRRSSELYNEKVEQIENMEKAGRAFVIRPRGPVLVKRNETDVRKIDAFYQEGVKAGMNCIKALREWLK